MCMIPTECYPSYCRKRLNYTSEEHRQTLVIQQRSQVRHPFTFIQSGFIDSSVSGGSRRWGLKSDDRGEDLLLSGDDAVGLCRQTAWAVSALYAVQNSSPGSAHRSVMNGIMGV